jgi:uncharacterized protein
LNKIDRFAQVCQSNNNLELAFLVGSQASGKATTNSDWDIALQWTREMDFMHQLAQTEVLRIKLARSFEIPGY